MAKKKKSKDQVEYEILLENVKAVMSTHQGREVIWYILDLCPIYSSAFTGNSQTFYLEGQRDIGLDILKLLEDADPTLYPKLILEKQGVNND